MDRQTRILVDQLAALSQTRQGRRVLLVTAVIAAIAWGGWFLYQQYHQRHLVTGPTVRLATWNLHEFSPRPRIDLRRIAEIIQSNHFDLLAIQEVRGTGEEVDALLNVLGPPWRATRYSPTSGNHERFAFLYNGDKIEELGPPQPVALPGASVFARTPYEDTFRAGNFQFTIVTVHLEWTNKSLREQEGQALAGLAPQLESASPQHHLIICGDFNEERSHVTLRYLESQGFERLIHQPTNLSSTEDFDNFLVDSRATTEWTGQAGVVAFDELYALPRHEAVESVSDHRPAWVDFSTDMPAQMPPTAALGSDGKDDRPAPNR